MAWAVAWAAMLLLDGHIDLANQALLLILASAVAAIWWGPWLSAATIGASVLAFNFAFVPPRGTLAVDLHHHGLLLVAMVSVSWIITAQMSRLRRVACEADQHARRSDELRQLGDTLREADDPLAGAAALRTMLSSLGGASCTLLIVPATRDLRDSAAPERWFGQADGNETDGLRRCVREGRPLGPGSSRPEHEPAWYLPLRGRQRTLGAALLRPDPQRPPGLAERAHAQALCDQMGTALERAAAEQGASAAREQAQLHAMRNTLLSAVAHDHRTPLATIVSAAGALLGQGERLDAAQRRRLASTIVDEATQLARITDNTLQLARLDAVGLDVPKDWESLEELIGSVLRRFRQRDAGHRLRADVEAGLPLVRCDAVLIVQLLDNLVDNALKYGGDGGPVEVAACRTGDRIVVAVRDRGPGIPESCREHVFGTFARGPAAPDTGGGALAARGSGVGLALCRAIARVHGGELDVHPRHGGGACFELSLPLEPAPGLPADCAAEDRAA